MNLKDPGNMKEELEERIINLWAQSTNDNTFTDLISKEVKDIAIEFANYVKTFKPVANGLPNLYQHPTLRKVLSLEELFEQFIKQRYESNN